MTLTRMAAAAAALALAVTGAVAAEAPRLAQGAQIDLAAPAPILVDGLKPRATVRVHLIRRLSKWRPDAAGAWSQVDVDLHAWAEVDADRLGRIDVAKAKPKRGTYARASAQALLWSGYPAGAPELEPVKAIAARAAPALDQSARFIVSQADEILVDEAVTFVNAPETKVARVREPGFVGVFAAPPGALKAPAVIVLHGSEGGELDGAETAARRFAAEGFPALALLWFVNPWNPQVKDVPTAMNEIPLEMLNAAHGWLARRPEVDGARVGVWGVSKGAEFSAAAAERLDWIKAAVPCVASDSVWEGVGGAGESRSTWTYAGAPLPFIPLIPFVEGDPRWRVNTDRYLASRAAASAEARDAARIRIENAKAKFLIIGSLRDEVWASGDMAQAMMRTLTDAGKNKGSRLLVFERAGHGVCSGGSFPVRLHATQRPEPWAKSLDAEGEAAEEAWRGTIDFFKKAL